MTSTFKTMKKNQHLLPPTTRRYAQASPLQDARSTASTKTLPGKKELLEQFDIQKCNTSGNAPGALSAKVECLLKLWAPAPPAVPRRGRVLRPAQHETLEREKAHQPDMNTPCSSKWMTEYMENFGFPKVVHQPRAPKETAHKSTPNPKFADKYRRTEYQAVYGPKIRTALFNVTLYRQIHGTA
ncbi:hypothetical protein PHYPO_G00233070 [Pangasianodon hypophthalmus]|uniref:Uncharacterized protein n=1 Tax=Pangasianodon hypophthalmus TaxID=310915 RepID=A0A5N5NL47_PANHP|nr:hypothetical protein PHYPO_G00233070 [Pangasianodon hypophthalmus]